MSLLAERLLDMPFGTAAVEELLRGGLLDGNSIYRRREIVEALRQGFIDLGGDKETSPQQVIVPLKRVLDGPLFARIRPGFYRYLGGERDDSRSQGALDSQPRTPKGPNRAGHRTDDAPWRRLLDDASTAHAVVAILRSHGRERVADRIDYLQQLAQTDREEQPMSLDSLWHMARFLLDQETLPDPQVGVTPNGLAQAEWTIPDISNGHTGNGLLAMEFLPRMIIRFAALSAPYRRGMDRFTVHGTLPVAEALEAVRTFTGRIARP